MDDSTKKNTIENAHKLLIEKLDINQLFSFVEKSDYLILFQIERLLNENNRAYIKDLSESMHRSIPEISKMMTYLQDKGYIIWKTDETKKNTYVSLTVRANSLMEKQKANILEYYQKIQETISKEDLENTSKTMNKIREIISQSLN